MKKVFLILIFFSLPLNVKASDLCIDKTFMKKVPQNSKQLISYVNDHYAELILMIEKNDTLAYNAGFKVLSSIALNNASPDNLDLDWKIQQLAKFLSFYEDRFKASLKKLSKQEVLGVFKFYDMKIYEETQPNDYTDIKVELGLIELSQ